MSELLREQQFTLARHLRDPTRNAPPPGIEDRRLRVYRELFFGAIEGLLASGFPVIRETLGTARWQALVRDFYAEHRSSTPLFPRIAGEFVAYLEARADDPGLPPWLPDLAHYEWIEQALYVSDAVAAPHNADGDLLTGVPVLSPLAIALAYRWPVTEIGPGHAIDIPPEQPTTLLVHRDADHGVHFIRITPLIHHLLASLQANAWSGREHLAALASAVGADPAQMEAHGLELLQQLHAQGILLGTASP